MIIYNFQSMDFVAFLCANIVEYRLAILFNSFIVEYLVSILRNDETIISSISVTDIAFDVYLGKWNYRAIPKVKTWSYFLTLSLIHISEPTRQAEISYAVFCLKK